MAYILAVQTFLMSHAGQIGGISVMPALQGLSAASLQIAPFLAALFLIMTAPVWASLAKYICRKVGVTDYSNLRSLLYSLLAHMAPAALTTLMSIVSVAWLANSHLDGIPVSALALAVLGLFVDLYLISLFIMALFGITRRRMIGLEGGNHLIILQ